MFKVSRSSYPAISADRQVIRTENKNLRLGTTSKGLLESIDGRLESTSAMDRFSSTPNTMMSNNSLSIDLAPMLTGLSPTDENKLHDLYRDIYYNDCVGGSAVDLMCMLPFGEFNLGGFPSLKGDSKSVQIAFQETIERLNIRTFIPELAVDYLVLGEHCSSLMYNGRKKLFTDILPHAPENTTVEELPFYSQDPIITVKFPESLKSILRRQGSKRVDRLREFLGADIVEKIVGGSLELDPLSTIYIPRRSFSSNPRGTSYFRRLLPIYLIEKNLYRGTLVESARRQRGIMHLSLGDGDQWIPTVQDMEFMTELFMNADSDPIGAIIATRMGVSVEEIRQGGEFWKSTDFADSVLSHKLRALGISEGFLSGESNYDASGTALTVFLEMIRSFRETMTRKFFYNKLFPLISLVNGFTVSNGRVNIKNNLLDTMGTEEALFKLNDGSKLFIPSVEWTKQLKPEGDTAYLEMLQGLTEKGVPVPLRAIAAAGGLDLESLIRQQEEDLDIRKKVGAYMKRIADLAPKEEGAEEAEASDQANLLALSDSGGSRSSVLGRGGRVNLLDRDFSGVEPYTLSKTGKKKHVINRPKFESKANDNIIRSLKELQRKEK